MDFRGGGARFTGLCSIPIGQGVKLIGQGPLTNVMPADPPNTNIQETCGK